MYEDEFQRAGEVCQNCRKRWAKANKPAVLLVALPVHTKRYDAEVAICPYCDGPILDVRVDAPDA